MFTQIDTGLNTFFVVILTWLASNKLNGQRMSKKKKGSLAFLKRVVLMMHVLPIGELEENLKTMVPDMVVRTLSRGLHKNVRNHNIRESE